MPSVIATLPPAQLAAVLVAVVVAIAVEGLLVVGAIRAPAMGEGSEPPMVEVAWTLLPAVLLAALFLYSAGRLGPW